MKLRTLVAAFAAVLAAGAAVAEPSYTSQITIGGYAGDETLENFPVLVRIKSDQPKGFDYSQCQGENGADISFTDAAGNVIPHEIDTWNPDGESTVWVKVPSISGTTTTFNFRWCDSAATSTSTANTWDSSYVMVFHMGEESGTCANSSQFGSKYDATPIGTTTDNKLYSGTDAPVGGARTVSTVNTTKSALQVPSCDDAFTDSDSASVFTWSAWCRQDAANADSPRLFVRGSNYDSSSWALRLTGTGSSRKQYFYGSGTNPVKGGTLPLQSWVHVVLVYNGTTAQLYNDGVLKATGTISAATKNGQALGIGNGNAAGTVQFVGAFDECRLKKGSVSAAWVKAEYDTVKTAGFLTYGEATQSGDAPLFVAATVDDDKVSKHTASVTCAVTSLGPGATSATVKLLYWIDGGATTNTVDVGSLTEKGALTANLENLAPGTTYCVQVVATNDKSETDESAGVAFTTETYLPGDSIALDGIGGDTIAVSGTVAAFESGKTCELTVLTGASEDSLSNEWSGLAGSTLSASADSTEQKFSFSLCEPDTASPRYIAPGSTVYVAVKAKIGDWEMQTSAKEVKTANTAATPTPTWTPDQKTLKVTGTLSDLGMRGKTSVSLWRYNDTTEAYEQEGEAQEITSAEDSYSFETRGEDFGTAYNFKVLATNISAGKTATNSVESAVMSFTPVDAATYTWTGRGTSGVWEDAANWSDNKSGECLGWPKSSGASVDFGGDENVSDVEILFTNSYTVANLYLTNSNVKVTFKKGEVAEGATVPTVSGTFNLTGTSNVFTVDGMDLSTSAGITLGQDSTWLVTNGASVNVAETVSGQFLTNNGGKIHVVDSMFKCRYYTMSMGAYTLVKDSTFTARIRTRWNGSAETPDTLRLEGAKAVYQQIASDSSSSFGAGTANAVLNLEFVIPKKGFESAPLRSAAANGKSMGTGDQTGKVYVSLIQNAADVVTSTVTTPLISWAVGITRSCFEDERLIGDNVTSKASLVWKNAADGDPVDDSATTAKLLYANLPGPKGCILIIR